MFRIFLLIIIDFFSRKTLFLPLKLYANKLVFQKSDQDSNDSKFSLLVFANSLFQFFLQLILMLFLLSKVFQDFLYRKFFSNLPLVVVKSFLAFHFLVLFSNLLTLLFHIFHSNKELLDDCNLAFFQPL